MNELDHIWSIRKRKEVMSILTTPNPTHNQCVYLVSFLKYAVNLSTKQQKNSTLQEGGSSP